MWVTYSPMVRFYRLNATWALTLPFSAAFYLAATVHSALNYWSGRGGQWKGMPSDSKTRTSSSLMTCPFASNFFPPGRNTVQQRTRPVEDFTSTVCALMQASQEVGSKRDFRFFSPERRF